MRRSTVLFTVIAFCAAALFVRLGIWQLDRLHQRRARNALVEAHRIANPVSAAFLTGDTASIRFRRVLVAGTPDFQHEFLLTLRGNNGSPGVDIITPFIIPGSDSAILVLRGWVYSPDGMTADLAQWRDDDSSFTGFVETFETGTAGDSIRNGGIRHMDYDAISRTMPFPIRQFYVVATPDSSEPPSMGRVVRLSPPPMDEGPHLSYAIQWFSFAVIAIVGAGIVIRRTARVPSPGP
jgi:surfeit locus 1 family protein